MGKKGGRDVPAARMGRCMHMDQAILLASRALLADETPLRRDCGALCGKACCQADEEGKGGVYLFPGEEEIIRRAGYEIVEARMPPSNFSVKLLHCGGHCRRAERPLGCMIFPLTPRVRPDGAVTVDFDLRARPLCPLPRDGLRGLRRPFVDAAARSMALIAADEEGLRFLRAWQALEALYRLTF